MVLVSWLTLSGEQITNKTFISLFETRHILACLQYILSLKKDTCIDLIVIHYISTRDKTFRVTLGLTHALLQHDFSSRDLESNPKRFPSRLF